MGDASAAGTSGRRPLTARSVIASTLLGVDPARLPAQALVRSGIPFGISESATRTALSRMAAAGEVIAEAGDYVLVGPLLERHARQQAARTATVGAWDGTWELAIVTLDRRPADRRAELRVAARRRKLAEVREGCWARPANLDPDRAPTAAAVIEAQCTTVRGAVPDDASSFLDAFDLTGWATTARELIGDLHDGQDALDRCDATALADTFLLAAHVLRHLVEDPLLPEELRPPGWPGSELRQTFDRFDAAFKQTWRTWHSGLRE